ncbi:MAG: hypothetical protein KOO65_05395 [Desulfobacterales bacterium]|nr:hypothetical protein [Desulfobacterales bacterium]
MAKVSVRIWMLKKQIKARRIAEEYGSSEVFICTFLEGISTSKPLTEFFIKKGCPAKYFKNNRVAS